MGGKWHLSPHLEGAVPCGTKGGFGMLPAPFSTGVHRWPFITNNLTWEKGIILGGGSKGNHISSYDLGPALHVLGLVTMATGWPISA